MNNSKKKKKQIKEADNYESTFTFLLYIWDESWSFQELLRILILLSSQRLGWLILRPSSTVQSV